MPTTLYQGAHTIMVADEADIGAYRPRAATKKGSSLADLPFIIRKPEPLNVEVHNKVWNQLIADLHFEIQEADESAEHIGAERVDQFLERSNEGEEMKKDGRDSSDSPKK